MSSPWLEQVAALAGRPVPAWIAASGAVLAAVAVLVLGLSRVRRARLAGDERARKLETALTVAAAGIATGVSASGMWAVFGDKLHMTGPARAAAFAFLEIALAVSAIRARRALRETGSTGVDGAAVWVLAGMTAVLSALDADNFEAKLLRLAAPLVAAWLWERGLAPDRRHGQVRRRGRVAWRITRERVLVWLRLAEPAERAVADVARARAIARLTRAAWRYHSLTAAGAAGWRRRRAAATLRRHTLAGVEHLALGEDDAARDAVRRSLAALYQVTDGTAPAALADLAPWSSPGPLLVQDDITGPDAGPGTTPTAAAAGPPEEALTGDAGDHLHQSNAHRTPGVQLSNDGPSSVQRVQSAPPPEPVRRPEEAGSASRIERPAGPKLNTLTAPPISLDAVQVRLDTVQAAASPSVSDAAAAPAAAHSAVLAVPSASGPLAASPPPEVDSASARADWVARRYREAHRTLPTARDLSHLANVSTGTAGTVLKALRDALQNPHDTNNDRHPTTDSDHDSHQTNQHHESLPNQHQPTHHDHSSHLQPMIQNSYTPRHHDPEEDQRQVADAPAAPPAAGPVVPSTDAETALRPAGDPVGVR